MTRTRLAAGVIFSGTPEEVVDSKCRIEDLLRRNGLQVIYIRLSPKRLYILEDDKKDGVAQE